MAPHGRTRTVPRTSAHITIPHQAPLHKYSTRYCAHPLQIAPLVCLVECQNQTANQNTTRLPWIQPHHYSYPQPHHNPIASPTLALVIPPSPRSNPNANPYPNLNHKPVTLTVALTLALNLACGPPHRDLNGLNEWLTARGQHAGEVRQRSRGACGRGMYAACRGHEGGCMGSPRRRSS